MTRTPVRVRFSDVDSMGIVWHGQYIRYFEDGREDFGNTHGINYLDFHSRGYLIPIVKVGCDYKRPLRYGDTAIVETRFADTESAKISYEYTIYNEKTGEVVATGSSTQVFLNLNHELLLAFPLFFAEWKKKNGLMTGLTT
ncbi:MAG: acyl-CoA thioesterase [Bacteroidales bacterium]|nr:acyl-CoA thioesterase [Bacteroidales bacterium]